MVGLGPMVSLQGPCVQVWKLNGQDPDNRLRRKSGSVYRILGIREVSPEAISTAVGQRCSSPGRVVQAVLWLEVAIPVVGHSLQPRF